ncbi:MAG: XRE family transcriptional regulator [Planctomycetaceae bacterium]|nr:XRE family transcriptional regulator [Planctomycetaceae bacterium]
MEKSVFTGEYRKFLELLRETRKSVNVTQAELAARLGRGQSFISKCERGEARIDVIQLRSICKALGTTLAAFVSDLEEGLNKPSRRR